MISFPYMITIKDLFTDSFVGFLFHFPFLILLRELKTITKSLTFCISQCFTGEADVTQDTQMCKNLQVWFTVGSRRVRWGSVQSGCASWRAKVSPQVLELTAVSHTSSRWPMGLWQKADGSTAESAPGARRWGPRGESKDRSSSTEQMQLHSSWFPLFTIQVMSHPGAGPLYLRV